MSEVEGEIKKKTPKALDGAPYRMIQSHPAVFLHPFTGMERKAPRAMLNTGPWMRSDHSYEQVFLWP